MNLVKPCKPHRKLPLCPRIWTSDPSGATLSVHYLYTAMGFLLDTINFSQLEKLDIGLVSPITSF